MTEIQAHRHESLYSVLYRLGVVDNFSQFRSLIYSSTPVFIDHKRVYDLDEKMDFLMKSKTNKLFDVGRYIYKLKLYSTIRIGGSLNPNNDLYGDKYMIWRVGGKIGTSEVFK